MIWSGADRYTGASSPLDGSELGESVVPLLLEIAGPLDMALVLMFVIEPVMSVTTDGIRVIAEDLATRRRDAAPRSRSSPRHASSAST